MLSCATFIANKNVPSNKCFCKKKNSISLIFKENIDFFKKFSFVDQFVSIKNTSFPSIPIKSIYSTIKKVAICIIIYLYFKIIHLVQNMFLLIQILKLF